MTSPLLSFQQSINLFDPLLHVREATYLTGKYIIERKGYIPQHELEFLRRRSERTLRFAKNAKFPEKQAKLSSLHNEVSEEYDSARSGNRIVLVVDHLDRRVFDLLAAADIQRYGGYSRYADELEKAETARGQQLNRDFARMREDASFEAFDKMNFAWRKKDTKLAHWDGRERLTDLIR